MLHGFCELTASDLVPDAWRTESDLYVFNPAIGSDGDGDFLFYRVVGRTLGRRIASCRLDRDGGVVPGSISAFSDAVGPAGAWFADPRVYHLRGRHYVYWNTGFPAEGENQQYIVEVDTTSLRPVGQPIELKLDGARQRIEKNWILFEEADAIFAIYSIAPHRVLRASTWTAKAITFTDAHTTYWRSSALLRRFGPPRGGAQPIVRGDYRYHFCHASSGFPSGSHYVAQCYAFDRSPPFRVRRFAFTPIDLPNPRQGVFRLPKLNPRVESVVYPAGNIAADDERILISYGVNDEASFIAPVDFGAIDRLLRPVGSSSGLAWRARTIADDFARRLRARLRR